MRTIALIIGHSPSSPGAINSENGVSEFEFNSELTGIVAYYLQQIPGFVPVIIYRDVYSELPAKVNAMGADIALSFHCNAHDDNPHGSETLYYHTSVNGKVLAEHLQNNIVKCLDTRDRGIKPIKKGERGSLILRKTTMPTVLLEPFFIDAITSLNHATDNMTELAQAICNGIRQYYE